jgi:predicted ArsR family transcriptional regulator
MLRRHLLDRSSSRGRIVALLRRGPRTADDMAADLKLTAAAIRAQITAMERDGIVQRAGHRAGATRPPQTFALTSDVEQLLSGAYVPLLIELVRESAGRLAPKDFRALMRKAGKGLAAGLRRAAAPDAPLATRVHDVGALLNDQLGSTMEVQRSNGHYVLRGFGCPLAELTEHHPNVCVAVESLVGALVEAPVHECCDRTHRPQCCFVVGQSKGRSL